MPNWHNFCSFESSIWMLCFFTLNQEASQILSIQWSLFWFVNQRITIYNRRDHDWSYETHFYNILIQPKILQTKRAAQPRLCPVKTASGWDESVGAHTGRHHHRGVAAGVGGTPARLLTAAQLGTGNWSLLSIWSLLGLKVTNISSFHIYLHDWVTNKIIKSRL